MNFQVAGKAAFAYAAAHDIDPARRTVVFLHGAGLDHSVWGLQSRYFGYHGRNVLALDFPAHGRSAGPALSSIESMADWVFETMKNLKIEKASLVGHSMGSLVALECAARQPARVERLALVGTAFPMKVAPAFLEAARGNEQAANDMVTIWGHAPRVPLRGDPSPGMWMYGDALARLARLAPGVLYNDLKACEDYAGGMEAAAKVQCPVLLVLGQQDVMTPARNAVAFSQHLKKQKTVLLEGSGHGLMVEAPDATLDALREFLA